MDAFVSSQPIEAIKSNGSSVASEPTNLSDDENWFAEACETLLPDKPGMALHCITKMRFDERNCQRYAAGTVKPPGYFVRALLRTNEGWIFLDALMEGCDAPWWRDLKRARRVVELMRE